MKEIEELIKNYNNNSTIIKTLKSEKKKIFGNFCNYIPEELIHAAGIHSMRLTQGLEPSSADDFITINVCPIIRSFYGSAQQGKFDFLDGLVSVHSCVPYRRLHDLWVRNQDIRPKFAHIMNLPHKKGKTHVLKYFVHEITELKNEIEEFANVSISNEQIEESIKLYNRNRLLLKQIHEKRKEISPQISGAEMLQITGSSMIMDKEENNRILEEILENIDQRKSSFKGKRILISGSTLDKPDLINLIEESGGVVVADDLCIGTRYFWDMIEENSKDPIEAIAKRYLEMIPCARMFEFHEERLDHVAKLIEKHNVEGVIYVIIKYCDDFMIDYPLFREKMDELGIPLLYIEREYVLDNVSSLKTRIEAFLEILEG